jgi:hypothetical protein
MRSRGDLLDVLSIRERGEAGDDSVCRGRARLYEDGLMKSPRTLQGFLLARLDEEETAALDSRAWYRGGGQGPAPQATHVTEPFAAFVLAHDPDRVLTECVAKRRMIKFLTGPHWSGSTDDRDALLRLLALPYAGHPAFRDEWHTDPRNGHSRSRTDSCCHPWSCHECDDLAVLDEADWIRVSDLPPSLGEYSWRSRSKMHGSSTTPQRRSSHWSLLP